MRPAVKYTPYATYARGGADNITTSAQFEEENLLSETREDAESGDKYNDNSIMPPIIS